MSAHATVKLFYDAFVQKDASTMAGLYAHQGSFSDDVFVDLSSVEAGEIQKAL